MYHLPLEPPSLRTSHPLRSSQKPGSVPRVLHCSFSPALCVTSDVAYMSVLLLSVLVRHMNLKPVTQSEVSQKEKSTYRTLAHVCGIWKNGADEPICREGMETQMWRMECGHRVERRGCDERNYHLSFFPNSLSREECHCRRILFYNR